MSTHSSTLEVDDIIRSIAHCIRIEPANGVFLLKGIKKIQSHLQQKIKQRTLFDGLTSIVRSINMHFSHSESSQYRDKDVYFLNQLHEIITEIEENEEQKWMAFAREVNLYQINLLNFLKAKDLSCKEDLFKLTPYLTFVDLLGMEKVLTSNELKKCIASCEKMTVLLVSSPELDDIPRLSQIEILDCSRCEAITTLKSSSLIDLKCIGCSSLVKIEAKNVRQVNCINCPSLRTLTIHLAQTVYCEGCSLLESISSRRIKNLLCDYCYSLTSFDIDTLEVLSCSHCISLEQIKGASLISLNCSGCSSLKKIEGDLIRQVICYNCPSLYTLHAPALDSLSCSSDLLSQLNEILVPTETFVLQMISICTLSVHEHALKEHPLQVFDELSLKLLHEKSLPMINFYTKEGNLSPGTDMLGLTRHFISTLFEKILFPTPQMSCVKDEDGFLLPYLGKGESNRWYTVGKIMGIAYLEDILIGPCFSPKLYNAFTFLDHELLSTLPLLLENFEIPEPIITELFSSYHQDTHSFLDGIFYEDPSQEEFKKGLLFITSDNIKLTPKELSEQVSKTLQEQIKDSDELPQLLALALIAKGVIYSVGEEEWGNLSSLQGSLIQERIEGALHSEFVLQHLEWSPLLPSSSQSFLTHWIHNQTDQLKTFVKAITGSPSLYRDSVKIKVLHDTSGLPGLIPKSSTCFKQLVLSQYENQEDFDKKMQLFLEYSLSGTGFQLE